MRTVSYKLADLGKVVIHLGKMAENDATQVRIDAAEVFSEYPNAVPALDVINPSGEAYTVEVTLDGTVIVWDVKDSSLTAEGNGEIQLTFTQDGTKVKSSICRTQVCRSITGGGTAPDPVQDWLDHANEVLEETGAALETLENMTASASSLPAGSNPTATYQNGNIAFGIPKGDKGDKGDPGKPMDIIDDTAGAGETERAWSADKLVTELGTKADKTDTVLLTTLSRGRKANTTVGYSSFAFGDNVTASGEASHAEGTGTVASALQSHAEGYGTTASGVNSHAEGVNTYASGAQSHAEGAGTSVSGQNAHAEGAWSQATSDTAHAEGAGTRASGGGSHAEGGGSVASGGYSHAEGAGTVASGSQAHAEGSGTQANGDHSHAEGQATKANAKESHAEGHYTVAAGEASHVFGKYNVADNYSDYPEWVSGTSYAVGDLVKVTTVVSGVTTVKGYKCYTANSDTTFTESKWTRYDYLHYVEIVGNGEGPNEYASNARTLDWDGNERLKGNIYVGCNADGSGGTKLENVTYATDSEVQAIIDGTEVSA